MTNWSGPRTSSVILLCLPLLIGCGSLDYVFPETAGTKARSQSNSTNLQSTRGPDRDRDGIEDSLDQCPQSGENALVNAQGCRIPTGVIEGLVFAPGDVKLSNNAKTPLDEIIKAFLRYPAIILSVTSHTDNRGSAADNLELSKLRLNAVVEHMVVSGIDAQRIQPFAYGESRPRAPNATLEGRERNRRIEIEVIEHLL